MKNNLKTILEARMATFSSWIRSERGTEVHRLGHREIRSQTYSSEAGVTIECYKFGSGKKDDPYVEKMFISLTNGYHQYKRSPRCIMTITNGKVELDPRFEQMIKEFNEE